MSRAISPRYSHDCEACVFVGRIDGRDCYIHKNPHSMVTYLARRSSQQEDYTSRSYFPTPEDDQGIYFDIWRMAQ